MKLPISWLKDFIDLDGLSVEDIARKLTLAGLEVDEIYYVGLALPLYGEGEKHEIKTSGIAWDRDKIVVAEIYEVKPHPNADRSTLLDLFDGQQQQVVLTGAPNIFHLKGTGKLAKPIKVAYAKEGSTLYDGHAEGLQLTTLKRAKIRGVDRIRWFALKKNWALLKNTRASSCSTMTRRSVCRLRITSVMRFWISAFCRTWLAMPMSSAWRVNSRR